MTKPTPRPRIVPGGFAPGKPPCKTPWGRHKEIIRAANTVLLKNWRTKAV